MRLTSNHYDKENYDKQILATEIRSKFEYKKEYEKLNEVDSSSKNNKDLKEKDIIPVMDRKTLFVGVLISLARKRLRSI